MQKNIHKKVRGLPASLSLLFLLLALLTGLSGCFYETKQEKQARAEENKETEAAMLTYLKDKYNQDFTSVEYIPAKRGFNDFYNKNVLVAKSTDELIFNVWETLADKGKFYDNYLDSIASKSIENKVDFSEVKNLLKARTFMMIKEYKVNKEEFLKGDVIVPEDSVIDRYFVVAVSEDANEEILKSLYDVYQQMASVGESKKNTLKVGFSPDEKKAEKYINNFLLYGTKGWDEFDDSVKEVLTVSGSGLSYEEFKGQVVKSYNE
ncbi:hypothetical protein [Bacillus sp. B-jedd]|uniref:hypothetical protein n=1 Tax=Bacillus sp. B-jedd TaxID=1476857 RepID=UPI0005155DA6|nr:hypothetical protein [Bacillus sp. B-jedd]CEG28527.1 hypothetical protein BN1002_03448 [Bacillus sp. B-jedd]